MDDESGDGAPGEGAAALFSTRTSTGELGSELADFQAGSGRKLQLAKRGWNRFDARRQKIFLEWFAATCNAKEAARRAGVAYSTVYRHRMNDARFAENWDRALEQGYARLEAKLLQAQFESVAGDAIEFDGAFEPDDAPDPALVDPQMAMMLLRQHRSEVERIRAATRPPANRSGSKASFDRPRLASDADVRRALVKSLRAFGVRVTAEDMRGDPDEG